MILYNFSKEFEINSNRICKKPCAEEYESILWVINNLVLVGKEKLLESLIYDIWRIISIIVSVIIL